MADVTTATKPGDKNHGESSENNRNLKRKPDNHGKKNGKK
jgi:hypothetical protein